MRCAKGAESWPAVSGSPGSWLARAQLDEKQYANLVAKRRMETGGFIVGDADGGCVRAGDGREGGLS